MLKVSVLLIDKLVSLVNLKVRRKFDGLKPNDRAWIVCIQWTPLDTLNFGFDPESFSSAHVSKQIWPCSESLEPSKPGSPQIDKLLQAK